MHTPEAVATAQKLGLNEEEYHRIVQTLGREPNFTELSIFSVMWSEHCCYKNSIRWLKTLPREGGRLLAKAGEENAGLIDLGGDLACAFKIESHNHPSAIEPYQGAATGVGGIHRDIFTMGARPIAALNSLRFGDIGLARTKWIVKGVVKGIGDYGNSFGVPTVAGEVYFDKSYNINPLVNAMSVGIAEKGKTVSAIAEGVGNPVFIVGSSTGKDGIAGAAFASKDITEDSAKDLPAVQVGDPFQEKLLLEASLEAIATGALVGMQDMGAAGITCSTSEMSAKGNAGMKVWLDKVPTRQANMKDWEILLSESQERMLVVIHKGREQEVMEVFEKWDLHCTQIGEVTDTGILEYYMGAEKVAEIPAEVLVLGGGAPVYERPTKRPAYLDQLLAFKPESVPVPDDLIEVAHFLTRHPNICSRRWIYEQYDSMVQTNTVTTNIPSDAALVRLKGREQSIAMKVDCNPYFVYADPYKGAQMAVAESARNIRCSGGEPLAVTNNLNFGNPLNPEVYYQFVEAVKGMGDACRAFDTPVTGGNVSFYNQSADGGAVLPTPTIGMVGLVEKPEHITSTAFRKEGEIILLLGPMSEDFASSQYLIHYHENRASSAPWFDLEHELKLHKLLRELIQSSHLHSAHDLAEGGLFIALLESCLTNNLGFDLTIQTDIRMDAVLFGEAQGRVVVSCAEENTGRIEALARRHSIDCHRIGQTTEGSFKVNGQDFGRISDYKQSYQNALAEILN